MAATYVPPCAAPFSHPEALAASDWLACWAECEPHAAEHIGECETQYRSECAMFGDAGVGQGYWLSIMKADYARCEALAARLHAQMMADQAASDARVAAYADAAEQAYFDLYR